MAGWFKTAVARSRFSELDRVWVAPTTADEPDLRQLGRFYRIWKRMGAPAAPHGWSTASRKQVTALTGAV